MNEEVKYSHKQNSFLKRSRNRFVQGLLVVVPLGVIIFLVIWVFNILSDFLRPLVEQFVEWAEISLFDNISEGFTTFLYRAISIILMVVFIYLIGWLASNYLGRKVVGLFEALVRRVPIAKQIYGGAQQIISSFAGKGAFNKMAFREVVIVEFPRKGMRTLGFITNEIKTESGQKLFNIYIPSTPFMTGGYFEILSESEITRTKLSVDEALQMILSGGIISPEILSINDDKERQKEVSTYGDET